MDAEPPLILRPAPLLFDDEGRPLAEGKIPASERGDVELVLSACPYSGSRAASALPMNESALAQTRRHLKPALDALAVLRTAYAPGRSCRITELWNLGVAIGSVPTFLALRADAPYPSGKTPAYVAVLAKAMFGVNMLTEQLALRELVPTDAEPSGLSADELFDATEHAALLVGQSEVCAGTPGMIRMTLRTLVDGDPDAKSPILALVDLDRVLRFGAVQVDLKILRRLHDAVATCVFADLGGERSDELPYSTPNELAIVKEIAWAIAELPPPERGEQLGVFAQLFAPIGADGDAALDRALQELAALWHANDLPRDVLHRADQIVIEAIVALDVAARRSLGLPECEVVAVPAMLGDGWARIVDALSPRPSEPVPM